MRHDLRPIINGILNRIFEFSVILVFGLVANAVAGLAISRLDEPETLPVQMVMSTNVVGLSYSSHVGGGRPSITSMTRVNPTGTIGDGWKAPLTPELALRPRSAAFWSANLGSGRAVEHSAIKRPVE
jgi:hypothetical protein